MLEAKDNVLILTGDINIKSIPKLSKEYKEIYEKQIIESLDMVGVNEIDGAGVAFIEEILERKGLSREQIISVPPHIKRTLEVFSSEDIIKPQKPEKANYFVRVGDKAKDVYETLLSGLYLASDSIWYSISGIVHSKGRKKGSVTDQAILIGLNAFPIVALLSIVIGFILTLQSGIQLNKFGANMFIADMLGVSVVRELGPLICAIIIAGRSGSAIASEIATMKVTEEIDALKMMALNPVKYVIVPKFHAITLTMPILVSFSVIITISAGLFVSVTMFDVALEVFINRLTNLLHIKDIVICLTKTVVFAWLIVIVSSYNGMKVTGGAEGVGKATTASVVASIFAVVIADAVFSLSYI